MAKKKSISKYGASKNKSPLSKGQLTIISKIKKPKTKRKPTKNALITRQNVIKLLTKIAKDFDTKQLERIIKQGLPKVAISSADHNTLNSLPESYLNPINFLTKCISAFLKHNNPKDAKRLFHILKKDFLEDGLALTHSYFYNWDKIEAGSDKDMVPIFLAKTHDYFDILDTNLRTFYFSLYNTALPDVEPKNDRNYFIRNYPSLGKQLAHFRSNKKKLVKKKH